MQWQEVCEHPSLQNLPFKIELNERGQILMSPVKIYHSAFQGKISRLLPDNGIVLPECAIKTTKGTKVADIAWCSEHRNNLSTLNPMVKAISNRHDLRILSN
jgi:hypothetical protein